MVKIILSALFVLARLAAESVASPEASSDVALHANPSAPSTPRYFYWRPEFNPRTTSPEKRKAFDALLAEYKHLTQEVMRLNKEIAAAGAGDRELGPKYRDRDAKIERAKLLEAEARLWLQ